MKKTKEFLKRRVVALLLAVLMVLSVTVPSSPFSVVNAETGDTTTGTSDGTTETAKSNVTITVQDSVSKAALTDVTLTVKKGEETVSPENGVYVLEQGATYTYSLSGKTGYNDKTGEFTVANVETSAVDLSMDMADIQISQTAKDLKVGESATFSVTNAVEGATYTWASDNSNVATVDANGKVTAVAEGTAKITASYNGKTSSAIVVTVTKVATNIVLAVTPNTGTDQNKVEVTVTGIPSDATGKVQIDVNGTQKYEVELSNQSEVAWTYEDEDLRGDYQFSATYVGDVKYSTSTSAIVDATGFTKSQKVVFADANNSELAPKLTTSEEKEFDLVVDAAKSNIKTDLEFKSSNENVLTVDADGKVTIKGSGTATITVTAIAKDNYLEASATYYVYVEEEYKLSNLEDKIQVAATSKIYDGNTDVKVKATLSKLDELKLFTEDIDASKGIKLEITATVSSKNAGSYNEITVKSIDSAIGYDAEGTEVNLTERVLARITDIENEKLAASYTINQRMVYLGTNNWTMTYGSNVKELIAKENGLVKEIKVAGELETGVVAGDTVDFNQFKATVAKEIYSIGTHAEIIQVDYTASNAVISNNANYSFNNAADQAKFGTLTVEQAKLSLDEILGNINITSDGGIYYQTSEGIWINGGALKATVGTDYQLYYDTVMFELNGTTDLTNTGYDVTDITTNKISGKLYLQKGSDTCAKVDFSFYIDTTAPEVNFGEWKERTTVLDVWLGAITFNNYQKSYYTIEGITYNDNVGDTSALGVVQSGVDSWQYYVYKVTDDTELTQESLQEYAKTVTWIDGTEDGKIPVCTSSNGELKDVQGNYIVLVKITDIVGNGAVYSTNGLVVDVTAPTVEILAADDTAIDEMVYYQDSVEYKVNFTDSETSAGLASAVIQVLDGEEEIFKYEVSLIDDSEKKESYTLSELKELATKTVSTDSEGEKLVADKESNNLKIVVTATDQAGNTCDPVVQKLMIDATASEIEVSFNNDADVKNEKYFNTDRVMTISYKEKNFDKNGVTFDTTKGENVSLETLVSENYYNIKSYNWYDSQKESDVTSYTNDRVNTLTLTFAADGEYSIVPHCKDLSEKTESSLTYIDYKDEAEVPGYVREFVIDKTAPVVTVTYSDDKVSVDSNNRYYTSNTVTATVDINERNFKLQDKFSDNPLQMDLSKTKGENPLEGEENKVEDYQSLASDIAKWSDNVNMHSQVFEFAKDANYTFALSYTDLAGNPAVYVYGKEQVDAFETVYFTVDDTLPNGEINIEEIVETDGQTQSNWVTFWKEVWHVITFNVFRNYRHGIQINSNDVTAGVETVEYYKTSEPVSDEQLKEVEWKETNENGVAFYIEPDEQYVVYAKITDKAGNVRYIYPESGVVVDSTKPEITVTITNQEDAKNGIYNEDVQFNVVVKDPEVGDTYSGLEKVWYTVTASGNVEVTKDYTIVDNSSDRVQKEEYKEYNKDFVIPADEYNSNNVTVQVHALDFSGNQYDSEVINLKIDIKEPTISVVYDLNEPANGLYYNATRTATVTVTERNFDKDAVRFNITNTDGTQPVISNWESSTDAAVSDDATHTCKVTFAADGDYTLTLNCTDLAGNDSNYTQVDTFTIDQTLPVIGVAFDNNNVKNNTYFDAPRTATITVTEHNFKASEVITAIAATLETQGITVPPVSSWKTVGDTHTATIYFGNDGDYSFKVNYSDLAGNLAEEVVVSQFTIDQTKPLVEIFDIVDRSANNGVVAPGVRYSDVNYDVENVSITIKGAKHDEESVDGTRSSITNGQSIKMADFAYEELVDDVYTLTVKVTDRAGNSDEKSVIFSVNRFGSTFIFSDATEAFLEKYYSNEEQDLVVTEINVDTLEHRGISYGRDGEHVNLEEGVDYTVKASGNEVSWKSYEYTIYAENFEEEGLYNVTIDSKDRAKNEVNNKIKDAMVEFVIDKTKPTVVITGIEAGGQYKASERDITIAVADNVAMNEVNVYVDGRTTPVENFNAEAIQQQNGELPYKLGSASDWQYVTAVATDAAGNQAETSEYGVLITSNILIQYYRNTPVFVGSIVAVLAIGGFIFFILGKKKNKEKEEQ